MYLRRGQEAHHGSSRRALGARSAMMPRHPSKEIADGTLNAILKQLGLKGK